MLINFIILNITILFNLFIIIIISFIDIKVLKGNNSKVLNLNRKVGIKILYNSSNIARYYIYILFLIINLYKS